MKPAPFEYHAPGSVEEALALLAEHGDEAKVLAGGQSLVPTMNFRLAQPAVLVDLNRLAELAYVREDDAGLVVGAMTRQHQVETSPLVARRAALVAETMPHIAHPQIRNRGTFGGSIAHADPSSELPAVLLALGGSCRMRGPEGERRVEARDFFLGLFETALAPEELLVEVAVPELPPGSGWAFEEVARRHGDFALVGAATAVTLDGSGRCADARLVYLSVGETPVMAAGAAAGLAGEQLTAAVIDEAARTAAEHDLDPPGDIHASAAYRRHLARVLGRRVLGRAAERAAR